MTRRTFTTFLTSVAVAPLLALPVSSAATDAGTPPVAGARPATVSVAKKTVEVRTTRLGKILVDSHGRTLYLFKKDTRGRSACSGECAKFWPPLLVAGKPTAGSDIKATELGVLRRSDGKRQVTYNGHPLYTFLQDSRPGQTNGQGVTAFGAAWFVLSPAGSQISRR
jgi:predicted lipoprotein with Yx(FWY)xxD motif